MRNKKLKKAILSTISIFAFTGIILSANLDNISKLQSSFSSEYSLQNDGFKNENESSEIINSEIESISSSAPLAPPLPTGSPTIISLKDPATINSIIAGHFPFQVDSKVMEDLVLFTSAPSNFTIAENVEFTVSGVNNVAAPSDTDKLRAGKAFINVSINNYYGDDSKLVTKDSPGYVPRIKNIPISNFKSVASQTDYAQIPGFITSDWYASDVVADTVSINNVLSINNGVTGIDNATNTSVSIVSNVFNNKDGILDVEYTLQNWFNNKGEFIRASSVVRSISVSNFKNVTGATTLILKDDGTTNTLIPSNIVKQLELNFKDYTTWFELVHVPKENTSNEIISSIKDLVPDDINGTIKLTYTITGEYFDADLVKQMSGPEGDDFTVTISGMNSQVEKVDIIPFVIGGSVGGVVLIAAIVTTIMLVSKSKKKKSENLRKQKLSEKVTPPTGGVTKSTNPVPSSISGSSVVPGGPKPPVGPSGPMNRPVPPPIRK